ncbi:uncharacterized protein LOC127867076 [Dreissena polymorpha]|uniref:Uncharacterized protein n=2 Tax=Dreissena polymorpha TaxID=45954 RepID=A0A9D4RG84_DREPO|nr:uncharacterized protein LOC127867076 [Dreissena polymorpha]XP_052263984.1 uncharacterized protein LOC127867076 [Dreissena polymorpha]XP_052263985.1 uncharacterized protein LOC127867076 [Dreissena polymorpha]XP_052263986.1 uncharacterized protein LOC127867076 [Dreissena polymorpha]KAH3865487.1 hypothetical protein DPMN_028526 [Dreissena polymorpha]KAH3865497.1 hypothetical protein DPMN_028536 [Dreissena polymorpha]
MMGAMDPMSAMMGAMGGMGMGAMAMGMPFMSYDTLEDMLDLPDRRMMPGVATGVAAGASVATGSMMPSVAGVPGVPNPAGLVSAGIPQSALPAPVVSAAVQPIGSGAHAASSTSHGTSSTGGINPSVIASALQTALSRVQQRGATAGNNNNQILG